MEHLSNCRSELANWLNETARSSTRRDESVPQVVKSCVVCALYVKRLDQIQKALRHLKTTSSAEAGGFLDYKTAKLPLVRTLLSSQSWRQRPTWLKQLTENFLIFLGVVLVAFSIFFVRSLLESRTPSKERSREAHNQEDGFSLNETLSGDSNAVQDSATANADPLSQAALESEDFLGESSDESEEDARIKPPANVKEKQIKVGNSEIWRLNLYTDSLQETRKNVVSMLTENGVPSDIPGFFGQAYPGGIQFDILVPKELVLKLRDGMMGIASKGADRKYKFAWFKNKSRSNLEPGMTRVVIWLSLQ